jgi:hypothetical protein
MDMNASLRARRGLLVVATALAGIGCSSSSAPQSWNSCNDLPPPQVANPVTAGTGAAPVPSGGTIVPGTYDVTATTVYGATERIPTSEAPEEYVFSDSSYQALTLDYAAAQGNWSTMGTEITLTYGCLCRPGAAACTSPGPGSWGYTATPTQILFIEQGFVWGGTTVMTYTKR